MAHKISVMDLGVSRLFPKPKMDLKRVAEAALGPLCYMALFYNLHQLARTYPFSLSFMDIHMAMLLSVLAILRSLFKESLVSPMAGLTSVGLMFRFLYDSGSLTRFGVIQVQMETLTVKIEFTALLIVILVILTVKTFQCVHEIFANLRFGKQDLH
jgi:hypothetical protein